MFQFTVNCRIVFNFSHINLKLNIISPKNTPLKLDNKKLKIPQVYELCIYKAPDNSLNALWVLNV